MGGAPADVEAELAAIVGEVFDAVSRHRLGLRIVDRSAVDWPALADLFVTGARAPVLALLVEYLERVTGQPLAQWVSETLWSPLGAEAVAGAAGPVIASVLATPSTFRT